jgi:hypothetical protein
METSDIAGRGTSDHCLRVGRGHATYAAKRSTDVEHGVLSLKPHFRPEWRGQDGQDETQKPYHSASLGDSVTSSTRIFRYTQAPQLPNKKTAPRRSLCWPHFSLSERFSRNSKVPRRNSSTVSSPGSVVVAVLKSMNAAFGYASQTARSSDVIVSHPNVNMYRPGSVTRPTCGQVILLTVNLGGPCGPGSIGTTSGASLKSSSFPLRLQPRFTSRQMSRPLHVAGSCLSVARAADVISQPIADLNGVRIDVRFLQRRGVQIHIGAASIILNEAEAALSIPHLQFSCRHYFPFFNPSLTRRRIV